MLFSTFCINCEYPLCICLVSTTKVWTWLHYKYGCMFIYFNGQQKKMARNQVQANHADFKRVIIRFNLIGVSFFTKDILHG